MTKLRQLSADESGSALIEVAFALPLLALLLGGTVDYGLYTERKMQAVEAANAAAAYGALPGNQLNTSGITTAAQTASPSLTSISVSPTYFWTCTPGGSHVTNTSICSGYGTPIQYVLVMTSATISAPMPLPGLGSSFTVNGQATYRVRWKPS